MTEERNFGTGEVWDVLNTARDLLLEMARASDDNWERSRIVEARSQVDRAITEVLLVAVNRAEAVQA